MRHFQSRRRATLIAPPLVLALCLGIAGCEVDEETEEVIEDQPPLEEELPATAPDRLAAEDADG